MNEELVPVDPTLPDELEVPDWVDDEDDSPVEGMFGEGVPEDIYDLVKGYRLGWDEVASLTAEVESLNAEVARQRAVIEENAKVYMRAIEYALTTGDNHAITFPH